MSKTSKNISQEELTAKTLRRIYNRGKRKGYVSPEYIEKTVKNKNRYPRDISITKNQFSIGSAHRLCI